MRVALRFAFSLAYLWGWAHISSGEDQVKPVPPLADAVDIQAGKESKFPDIPRAKAQPTEEERALAAKWIKQLGDEEYKKREDAKEQLRKLGAAAADLLREALKSSRDVEVTQAAEGLLADLETETWEGYYFSSLDEFELVCKREEPRTRFWFVVRRNTEGKFSARSDETNQGLGAASIEGQINTHSGEMTFQKQYDDKAVHGWAYEGKWSPERQRIEGTYGPNSGGFVLYPRKLTEDEKKKLDAPPEIEIMPGPE